MCLYLLTAKGGVVNEPDQAFIGAALQFMRACTAEQVLLDPGHVSTLCKQLVAHVEKAGNLQLALAAVRPLESLLGKMSEPGKPPHMTVVHRHFAQVCILSKCYKAATPVLSEQIIDLPADRTGLEPYDIVVFAYYGAMIHIGLKRYGEALTYLKMAFTASQGGPTSCLVESYKKYMLVSLIVHGKLADLPKWSSRMQQQMTPYVKEYTELKEAFDSTDGAKLSAKIEEHAAVFAKDNNLGLVKQCAPAAKRRSVKRLTQTYLTLSLADIAAKTGLEGESVESTILEMIEKGEIFASINQRDGMVSFLDNPEQVTYPLALSLPLLADPPS